MNAKIPEKLVHLDYPDFGPIHSASVSKASLNCEKANLDEKEISRNLYDESSFWKVNQSTVRNEQGFEILLNPMAVILKAPEGEVTFVSELFDKGAFRQVTIHLPAVVKWNESNDIIHPADVSRIIGVLEDALFALEFESRFTLDRASISFDA